MFQLPSLDFFMLPEAVSVVAVCAVAIGLLMQRCRFSAQAKIWDESLSLIGHGLILFDQNKKLLRVNRQALDFLPLFQDVSGGDYKLPDFLDYLFDHSIEAEESLAKAMDRVLEDIPHNGFRDVISTELGLVLAVEVQKTPKGLTVVTVVDLQRYQRQEETFMRLNRSNYQLFQAVEATSNGIVVSDAKLKSCDIIFANKAFGIMTGLESRELVGQSLRDWFRSFCGDAEFKKLSRALDEPKNADVDVSMASDDGGLRWYNIKLTPVFDELAELDLFICIFTETTELKIREAEFFQSKKLEALGQLAAGVAHDFNNVLSIVDGYARMTSKNLGKADVAKSYLEKITVASARGAALTRQMLAFSRHKVVSERIIDMVEVLEEQEALLEPLLGAGIKLSVRNNTGAYLPIECSQDALAQIVMNLCVNARDAMPEGGKLSIETGKASLEELPENMPDKNYIYGYAYLRVKDTGCGMNDEVITRIFDPFYTTKQQGQGTGLGLSMVYGLVKEAGGYIDVASSVGQGTVFTIFLPLSDKEPSKKIEGSAADVGSLQLKGYTALVAEDEEGLLEIVSDMLEQLGMTVLRARNGNEALLKQDEYEGDIDLLLTDVIMPELNGVKLAELFQCERPEAKMIFMSGYPAGSREAKMELPALPEKALFVAKPFNYDDLALLVYHRLCDDKEKGPGSFAGFTTDHWETAH